MAMTSDTMYINVMNDEYSEITETISPLLPGSILANKHFVDVINPLGHMCIQATMAHGIPDKEGGFTVTMGCQTENVVNVGPLSHYHVLFRIDPNQNNKRELIAKVNLGHRRPSYMHHNGHTQSSHVIIATPLYMDFERVGMGKGLANGGLVTPEGDTSLFQVVSKKDGSVREFETDGFLMGHVVNSYDDGDDIVVDLTYSTTRSGGFFKRFLLENLVDPVMRDLFEKYTLMRYRLKADGTVERSLTLPDEPTVDMELPMVHPDFEGKKYCVFWGVQFTANGKSFGDFTVVKRNLCTGENITVYREGLYPSEHHFIPRPGGTEEDDGALVGLVYDGVKDESFIEVLDAKTLKQLGKADFGMKIPFAVHTSWFGADAATQSMSV
jgi:carotenoid cleavage dioxygenase-like enzyme